MMKGKTIHIAKLAYLICPFICFFQFNLGWAQDASSDDSIRVEELLVMDTLGLQMLGPSNDVAFYLNGLVFLSNPKYHQAMIPDHIAFGQVTSFFAPLEYVALESSRPLFPNDAFPYAPGGTCFSRDFKTVYFTKKTEIPGNTLPEKIYEMSIVDGKATTYNQLSFTAGQTRYMHPAISVDGEFMIVSSDLFPSNGGLDLFIVRKGVSGWSTPVNMGADINTGGHDWYPFLDQHNNLFFSSSGHMGFGGYDLYVCFFNGSGWNEPQNLSDMVNTPQNEFGFSIHPGRKMAIFSTNSEEDGHPMEVLKLQLNNSAFVMAGIDTKNQDFSLLLKDMLRTGYTSAEFGAASELEVEAGFNLTALPLLTEEEIKEPEQVAIVAPVVIPVIEEPEPILVVEEPEPEPELQPELQPEPETKPEPAPISDPNQVIFRVQILSKSKANSSSSVTVAGSTYSTWEYFYKGAYRVTVGAFTTVQEASAFSKKCRSSGFNQSFVAAFRGDERETDPSVFKR
jgi:hypothetical protein